MLSKEKLLEKIDLLLGQKEDQRLRDTLAQQDFHSIAYGIDHLRRGKRKTFTLLQPEVQSEVILALNHKSKGSILPRLADHVIARFLHFNDEDDATDLLQLLPEERRNAILGKMREEKGQQIRKLLRYGSETAGGIMDFNFIVVKPDFTLKDVAAKVQQHKGIHHHAPIVLVADKEAKIEGFIPYRKLIIAPPHTPVKTLVQNLPVIRHSMDRERVIGMIIQRRSDVVCVADDEGRALGVVHLRDLLRVAEIEATEDVYGIAGVDIEEDIGDAVFDKVRRRHRWLIMNLGTALVASLVIALFQGTIAKVTVLAIYMPIVAGLGGNAATQALAVTIRGLAVRDVHWRMARPVILKETLSGACNGVIVGAIAAAAATAFGNSPLLGVALGSAMIINLGIAGLVGSFTPFIMRRIGVDPATASSVFVTATTDTTGFCIFLGLGTWLLL